MDIKFCQILLWINTIIFFFFKSGKCSYWFLNIKLDLRLWWTLFYHGIVYLLCTFVFLMHTYVVYMCVFLKGYGHLTFIYHKKSLNEGVLGGRVWRTAKFSGRIIFWSVWLFIVSIRHQGCSHSTIIVIVTVVTTIMMYPVPSFLLLY
jgi:hypothetical protein